MAPPLESVDPSALAQSCATTNPFLAVARYADPEEPGFAEAPAIVVMRDTVDDGGVEQTVLATQAQVGAVFGLAYDAARGQMYAAAYHKRGVPFGPGGPGAIYRIDVATGQVVTWATVPAGPDHHDLRRNDDEAAAEWVGHTGLGDIELSEGGDVLFVTNLYDGSIYRYAVPDGTYLGRFRNGASGSVHAGDLWPFGLAVHEGRLYHAVTISTNDATEDGIAAVEVYRSSLDGSDLELFARFPSGIAVADDMSLVPLPVDLVGEGEDMVVILRSRSYDALVGTDPGVPGGLPFGNLLAASPQTGLSDADQGARVLASFAMPLGGQAAMPGTRVLAYTGMVAELDDSSAGAADASVGLAPRGAVRLQPAPQATATETATPEPASPVVTLQSKVIWMEATEGDTERIEVIASTTEVARAFLVLVTGDVEALCAPRPALDPDLVATGTSAAAVRGTATSASVATAVAGTSTAAVPTLTAYATSAGGTATAAAATATAALGRQRPAAPSFDVINEACAEGDPMYAVAILGGGYAGDGGAAGSRATQPQIVVFNAHRKITVAEGLGAAYGLAYDWRRGQLYASAYQKRFSSVGPAGLGAIYRIDLQTGTALPWAWTNAGSVRRPLTNYDAEAAPWVGKLGYGDIDIAEDGRQLLAANLFDGLIYRFSVPDGALLGTFANGGARELWRASARPMGLGIHEGQVYHAVVNGSELGFGKLEAVVYRSNLDGSNMTAVARLDLGYRRSPRWRAWSPFVDPSAYYADPQAMVADIEWTAAGQMIVGLRDRAGDASFSGGVGDVLLADAGGWFRTSPSFYRMTRTAYGALAADPSADVVVTTALDSTRSPYTGVAQWLDNATGRVLRTVTIYRAASSTGPLASEAVPGATCGGAFAQPGSASWTPPSDGSPDLATTGRAQAPQRAAPPVFGPSKVKGSMLADLVSLGDLESLCPPSVPTPTDEPTPTSTVPPTASATPWRTATRVPTGTPSPTATRVPTGTPTPTSVPGCIYLPVLHDERCVPEELHADVVLVLDLSTSMLRESAGSGSKLEGALVAARLFVGLLDLEPDAQGRFDRAGIVGFNDAAWTEVGLTSDGAALGLALDALPGKVAEGTRLDLALDQGQATLAAAPRTGVGTVMVLLTDGLPNRVPLGPGGSMVETVVERAAAARGTGTRVFTIGLGMPDDVLRGLLVAVASGPDDYYYAPTSAELADIYRQIAGRINECP